MFQLINLKFDITLNLKNVKCTNLVVGFKIPCKIIKFYQRNFCFSKLHLGDFQSRHWYSTVCQYITLALNN